MTTQAIIFIIVTMLLLTRIGICISLACADAKSLYDLQIACDELKIQISCDSSQFEATCDYLLRQFHFADNGDGR